MNVLGSQRVTVAVIFLEGQQAYWSVREIFRFSKLICAECGHQASLKIRVRVMTDTCGFLGFSVMNEMVQQMTEDLFCHFFS